MSYMLIFCYFISKYQPQLRKQSSQGEIRQTQVTRQGSNGAIKTQSSTQPSSKGVFPSQGNREFSRPPTRHQGSNINNLRPHRSERGSIPY